MRFLKIDFDSVQDCFDQISSSWQNQCYICVEVIENKINFQDGKSIPPVAYIEHEMCSK